MIPYGRHEITEEDFKQVKDILEFNFLTQGQWFQSLKKFDVTLAKYVTTTNSAISFAPCVFSFRC